jgi:hypothetical protein
MVPSLRQGAEKLATFGTGFHAAATASSNLLGI